ncbi:MAG: amidohydrolase family protein, partial [Defluviitaleaceae bacterium]|nr:amidohydrolase family protein [Defluviitaleaceae bacterium]
MHNNLLLKDYDPISMLSVPVTEIIKPKFPVFDAHIHIGALQMHGDRQEPKDLGAIIQGLKDAGVFGVVSLKMFWDQPLKQHLEYLKGYEDFVHTFASVDVTRLEEPGFAAYADNLLKEFKSMGIRGLKFWKNIGCTIKDSKGHYIRVDDDRLQPIWEAAAKYDMLVLFHIADPKSFFTPVDEKNEFYESLCENPDWSFYGEGRFSFEELMQQQDNLLTKNPNTTFVIPHFGSNAEDLAWVGAQLDKHPNMHIDIAARLNLLGRQPYTAREFFIKYQDRILFGTDYGCDEGAKDFYA